MGRLLIALAAIGLASVGFALAQDDERSRFVRFVERQISTPDRKISLGQIDGALSSDVKISEITIADRLGVWLTITDAQLVWSRLALLRGRLDIDSLRAETITITRPPLSAENNEPLEDGAAFALPDLPVAVLIDALEVGRVEIAEGLIGTAAALKVDGSAKLDSGELDVKLSIERLDQPGTLVLDTSFDNESRHLALDFALAEPAGGVLANALNVDGTPALSFAIKGEGQLDDYTADINLTADNETLLTGQTRISGTDDGLRFIADLNGNLEPLVADQYEVFVAGGSSLKVDALRTGPGTITVSEGAFKSGISSLNFTGAFAADGVPTALSVNGKLGQAGDPSIPLPGGSGAATISGADIEISLGEQADGAFSADIRFTGLNTAIIATPEATLTARGTAENLADRSARAVTFTVTGRAEGLASDNVGVADALGNRLALDAQGSWRAGSPASITNAAIETDTVRASFQGAVGESLLGRFALKADDISAFAALADRTLSGSVDLTAEGMVGFSGLADLTVDATAGDLSLDLGGPDALLAGQTRVTGRAARTDDGVRIETFRVTNPQLALAADGTVSQSEANLQANLDLNTLAAVDERLSGAVSARLDVTGAAQNPTIAARVTSDEIGLVDRTLNDLALLFDGTYARQSAMPFDLDGRLSVNGDYAGEPLSLSARLESAAGARSLSALMAKIVDASAEGSLTLRDGLLSGQLQLAIPELARLAPLALTEATGKVDATVRFSNDGTVQTAALDGTAGGVSVAGITLGFAAIDLDADDVFGVPILNGRADVRALTAGGFDVRTLALVAAREGATTDITLNADLGKGTLDAAGRLDRTADGFAARVSRFRLEGEGASAILEAPTRVVVGETITVAQTRLSVGGGRVTVGGTLGETLDFEAMIESLPLSIANLVREDLGVAGTVSGSLDVSGRRADPIVRADVTARGVTAAMLRENGVEPLDLTAAGRFSGGQGTIDRLTANIAGGEFTATGAVGYSLDLNTTLTGLPLAIANAFVPDLGLSGTLSGNGQVTGTLQSPSATFEILARDASATALRQAGVGPADADLAGTLEDDAVTLSKAEIRVGGGSISASGTAGNRLDLEVMLRDLPLAIANGVQAGLGLEGALSGEASIEGRASRPAVAFNLEAPAFSTAATRAAGFGPGSVRASGFADGPTVRLDEAVIAIGGGEVRATGAAGHHFDLTIDLTNLPLALAGSAAPDIALGGRLAGKVTASGSAQAPRATFELSVAGLSAGPLQSAGVGSVDVRANGEFAGNTVTLTSLEASGAGLDASASGQIPLSGGGLDLSVNANAPLSLANQLLASRGARIDGQAVARIQLTGAITSPSVTGDVSASAIEFRDPLSNLVLQGGTLDAALSGQSVTIRRLTAELGGGSLAVSGTVGLGAGFPADLNLLLRQARYADGELFAVTLDGDIAVTGPLTGTPLVSGSIFVSRAEITVPETFAGGGALIDVHHVGASRAILETLRRAKVGPYKDVGTSDSDAGGLVLDVTIDAPARVFVRGRGINAELGGRVRLTGPVSNVAPVGRFELIRGQLVLLGKRISFVEGAVTLLGDLDPTIRLVAETSANSVTVRVIVQGDAQDPDIVFESDPELPQDEILSQLLFSRSISDLSAFQIAQLAAAVAELAGAGGGPGILEQIRVFTGLDNLEIITDDEGNTSAEAGSYIADNIYLGVRAGEESSGVTVNLDVTRDLKIRAEALTDETAIGVYYEREY